MAIRAHTFFLSDDKLRGRDTGSPGADTAAAYIARECHALGLTPLGASYEQAVPIAIARTEGSELEVRSASGRTMFREPSDFIVNGSTALTLVGFQGPPVFVLPEEVRTGRLPPLVGAVAVTLGSLETSSPLDTLRAHGATGAVIVPLNPNSGPVRLYTDARSADVIYVTDTSVRSSYFAGLPSVVTGPGPSRGLLEQARSMPSGGVGDTIIVRVRATTESLAARNIGCVLEGSDRLGRDSAIVFTAHYDHLGVGLPDERGDSIYNGFSDNAAGVAMLLAIAQAWHRAPEPPRHSIIFLFFTGEERGLLGSDYYVAHPTWPLVKTIGVINLDAGAPPARVWSWRIAGGDHSALGRLAVDVALARGWSAVTSGPRANSDYFPFLRVGVPAIFLVPGPAPYQGLSADSSQALRRRWDHYHQPSDEWHNDFPFVGLQRYAEFAFATGQALDHGGTALPAERGPH